MTDLAQYDAVKADLRPGDIVVCHSNDLLSVAIEILAGGPSHSMIVRHGVHGEDDVLVTESTRPIFEPPGALDGVQTHPLGLEVARETGWMAALLLDDLTRARIDWLKFYEFLGATDGIVRYDVDGLFEFLLRQVPLIGPDIGQVEKTRVMYCSALVMATLRYSAGVFQGWNWSKSRPQDLVEAKIWKCWVPLKGSPTFERFNTVE